MQITDRPIAVVAATAVPKAQARRLYRHLAELSSSSQIFTLPGHGLGRMERAATALREEITTCFGPAGSYAVCHSQSGDEVLLIAEEDPAFFSGIIMQGVPVHGTPLARVWQPQVLARQLAKGSRLIRSIEADLGRVIDRVPVVSIFTVFDELVPWRCSYIEGAQNFCLAPWWLHRPLTRILPRDTVLINGLTDHVYMPLHPGVIDLIAGQLSPASALELAA